MFHSISQNPPHRVGKIFCDLSYIGKSTTFAPGREDWNLKKISHAHEKFNVSWSTDHYFINHIYFLPYRNTSLNLQSEKTTNWKTPKLWSISAMSQSNTSLWRKGPSELGQKTTREWDKWRREKSC